jgi:hypothetical protein
MHALPPGWEVSENHLIYRGRTSEPPPDISRVFQIPLSQSWFGALFTSYKRKGQIIYYKDDAYLVATGYIVYSRAEAYLDGQWLAALKKGFFAVQVEWAEKTDKLPKRDRSGATLQVAILEPNAQRMHLEKVRTFGITQQRFLAFLKSGNLANLEPLHLSRSAA